MQNHPAASDISRSLAQTLGKTQKFIRWQAVSGGSIHQAWHVESNVGQHYFIKTNKASNLKMFETEAKGLKELENNLRPKNPIRVPRVYDMGSNEDYAWLVLAYIPFSSHTPQSESKLGRGLALLHQQTSPTFGLNHHNVIGSTPQINTPEISWLDFFAKHRLQIQFDLAKKRGFYAQIENEAESTLGALPQLLEHHNPNPSLLHGDLWHGNAACDNHDNPIIFDPAIYYGDRECDLAMTELFGGFSSHFYAAYNDVYPLEQDQQQRKQLYNLYHMLNHANIFAGAYIKQCQSMMRQLVQGL